MLFRSALPGGIYIYQGEELGLEDADLPDESRQDPVFFRTQGADKGRDGARVPLPWQKGTFFGFSAGKPWLPMPESWIALDVASQREVSESSLNLYRTSLRIRASHPALQKSHSADLSQSIKWLKSPSGILAFSRNPNFVLISNTTDQSCTYDIAGELLLASSPDVTYSHGTFTIPAHTTCWINIVT